MNSTPKTTLRKPAAAWQQRTLLLTGLFMLAGTSANANTPTCPSGATTFSPGFFVNVLTTNSAGLTNRSVGGGTIGPCTPLWVAVTLAYVPQDASGNICSAFSDGQIYIRRNGGGFTADVTPAGGVPLIGPVGDPANCPGAVPIMGTRLAFYGLPSVADIATGQIFFGGNYRHGTAWIAPGASNAVAVWLLAGFVNIAPATTCTVVPAFTNVWAGGSASFTAAGLPPANGPFTFRWTGPNGFASTSATITITNAQAVNAGVYTVIVTDAFGCTSVSSGNLVLNPNPVMLLSARADGGNFEFLFETEPDRTYTVQCTDTLLPANWQDVASFPGEGLVTKVVSLMYTQRFYRVVAH